jgi:hypothetical protein
MLGLVSRIDHDRFLPNPLQFIIQLSSYLSTLYVPDTDSVIYIRGRVSKSVINGSKTPEMDVIGFLCVSLGSSTGHIQNSLGSRRACARVEAGLSNQNGDNA